MALSPLSDAHAAQILAGVSGRLQGHKFEEQLTGLVNLIGKESFQSSGLNGHHYDGNPAVGLLNFLLTEENKNFGVSARAEWLGGLGTGGTGSRHSKILNTEVKKSKSDLVVELNVNGRIQVIGISVKTCSKKSPTNAQIYFTTATAFCERLENAGVDVPVKARNALRKFCGDLGSRPSDLGDEQKTTRGDRYFWEEIPAGETGWWKRFLTENHYLVLDTLLRLGYDDDPLPPSVVLHQRSKPESFEQVPIAVYWIDDLISRSIAVSGFYTKPYRVFKGTGRDPTKEHQAPRFGIVQFQRGGQKQHPTQLQFNFEAGYFNKEIFL
jgi:hypothetical protein